MIRRGLLIVFCLLVAGAVWPGPGHAGQEADGTPGASGWIEDPLAVRHLEQAYRFQPRPADLARSWERALVFVPGEEFGQFTFGVLGTRPVRDRLAALPKGRRYPLVIFLHDADGPTVTENTLMDEFEVENIAALFPDSRAFRRQHGPDCTDLGCAMSPEAYLARRAEMIDAVNRARRLPWVDRDNIFLVGLGEGGAVVALWGAEVTVKAYAVANWTCTAPTEAPWFDGLRTPADRPVLLINSRATRWSGRPGWDGRCAERPEGHPRATTVMIDSSVRNVFSLPSGRRALIGFLQEQRLR